jgi:hypothetical protein
MPLMDFHAVIGSVEGHVGHVKEVIAKYSLMT